MRNNELVHEILGPHEVANMMFLGEARSITVNTGVRTPLPCEALLFTPCQIPGVARKLRLGPMVYTTVNNCREYIPTMPAANRLTLAHNEEGDACEQ